MVQIGCFQVKKLKKLKLKKLWPFRRTKPGTAPETITIMAQPTSTDPFRIFNHNTQSNSQANSDTPTPNITQIPVPTVTVNPLPTVTVNPPPTVVPYNITPPTSVSPRLTTKLDLLSPTDHDYETIYTKFMSHIPAATVKGIFRLAMPDSIVNRHELMKKTIPVPRQTFHGTKHQCDPNRYITSKGEAKPCSNNRCGLCGIIKDGNRCDRSNNSIWSATHASTSLYYTLVGAPIRVMFVLDILTLLPENNATPHVIQDAATIPRFLILFQHA
ncbi:1102_t:CDS:2 [Ambispora gerdemannii]|uniref:1102_t:CDS:1 n=1 Tax=Ambispora gerdemannii TaxID=144530 RepID=A0A9N9F6P4_9GLOM|nr:1102_t:CDS:2 [Ambispora gerdemannii]